jgi:hypothetical protein
MKDDITIDDHLTIKDRGDERMVPDAGITLYVDNGTMKTVDENGVRALPLEELRVQKITITE